MVNMSITLPDPMKDWIEDRAQTGRYTDASDYIRDLIRQDQEQTGKIARMQSLVDEAMASGDSDETMADILLSMNAAG